MLCITDTTTDPYWNLAAEEHLLKSYEVPVFRLWRNKPSIIIGRYQNALAEINTEFVHKNNIPVVRRLTGGGAVFHDLGNLNYTFIDTKRHGEDSASMFRRFTAPIIAALRNLGIDAALEGRNDLVISGRKFSGNAICVHGDRVLQHGTLLFSASMNSLADALNTRPEKFIGKSVKSNRSRVTNISEHLHADKNIGILQFIEYLREYITHWNNSSSSNSDNIYIHSYSEKDLQEIQHLRDKRYATEAWNFGQSPHYSFSNTFKLPCGLFEIFLDVRDGIINDCRIMGDYFFLRPTEEICTALIGRPHTYEAILSALSRFPLSEYFGAEIAHELTTHML